MDADGLANAAELTARTDPFNPDSDDDGMPDGWEITYSLNPRLNDSGVDADYDGVSSLREYRMGTKPDVGDTDYDGSPDNQDTDPRLASVHPLIFDTYWHGMGGNYYSNTRAAQTGWAGRNWGLPVQFSPTISSWTTPAQARGQLEAAVAWPADFSQAQVLPVPPPVAELLWLSDESEVGGEMLRHADLQVYERFFRCRRDFAHPWQQDVTLLRLILPQTPSYENEFIIGQVEAIEKV